MEGYQMSPRTGADALQRKIPRHYTMGPVDQWLQSLGYSRKHCPRDSTCLFRAFSEQIYLTQYYHIRVRKECIEFMRANRHIFEKDISIPYDVYLEQMTLFTEWGSMNEIRAMSLLYQRDVVIFNTQKQNSECVTLNGFEKKIDLCFIPQKQYESVFTIDNKVNTGFCQSIAYQMLYKNVFQMENVEEVGYKMLHDRNNAFKHDKFFLQENFDMRKQLELELYKKYENSNGESSSIDSGLKSNSIPFPYKVAKALDPNIYRNIDYDVWHDIKREVKSAGWIRHKVNDLQIGGKCLIRRTNPKNESNEEVCLSNGSNEFYHGYIQEMCENEACATVFVQEIGERRVIPYSALKPAMVSKRFKQTNWVPSQKKNVVSETMNINSSQNKSQDLNSSETNTDIGIDEDDISWEKDKSNESKMSEEHDINKQLKESELHFQNLTFTNDVFEDDDPQNSIEGMKCSTPEQDLDYNNLSMDMQNLSNAAEPMSYNGPDVNGNLSHRQFKVTNPCERNQSAPDYRYKNSIEQKGQNYHEQQSFDPDKDNRFYKKKPGQWKSKDYYKSINKNGVGNGLAPRFKRNPNNQMSYYHEGQNRRTSGPKFGQSYSNNVQAQYQNGKMNDGYTSVTHPPPIPPLPLPPSPIVQQVPCNSYPGNYVSPPIYPITYHRSEPYYVSSPPIFPTHYNVHEIPENNNLSPCIPPHPFDFPPNGYFVCTSQPPAPPPPPFAIYSSNGPPQNVVEWYGPMTVQPPCPLPYQP